MLGIVMLVDRATCRGGGEAWEGRGGLLPTLYSTVLILVDTFLVG